MTTRDRVHQRVDRLSDDRLSGALLLLEELESGADPILRSIEQAEEDDEPLTPEDITAIEEARRDPRPSLTTDEVRQHLGLSPL